MDNICTSVYCIELDKTYPSVIEAEKAFGLTKNSIEKVINGYRNGAGGFHFIKVSEKDEETMLHKLQMKTGKSRIIVCTDEHKAFKTLKDAGQFANISAQSVMLNCQGKRKTCAGHNFQYFDDYIKDKTLADIQLLFKE